MDTYTARYISMKYERQAFSPTDEFVELDEAQAEIDRLKEEKAELVNEILRLHRKINDGCPNSKT